jgi:glycosyltransferase involved in cell wall biosynthesis
MRQPIEREQPLRILYAAGPGNVIGTYRHWKDGRDDPSQVNVTLSGLFYDLCRDNGDEAYVIASCPSPGHVREGNLRIEHRRTPFAEFSGVLYHLGQMMTAARLVVSAVRFRADVAVIACGTCHWFPLRVLPLFGVKVVPSLHCVMWRKFRAPGLVHRIVRRLNAKLFSRSAFRVLSMSRDITEQLEQVTAGKLRPVLEFLPSYRHGQFDAIPRPDPVARPFRVFYAGRIERSKGVFDLLEVARRFKAEGVDDVVFDVCGSGGDDRELAASAQAAGVTDRFLLHGYCNQSAMRGMYARSHAVVVPTTSDFIEGFNQVVSEAVLAGRPVITSAVCPALWYVRDAAIEVPVDDVRAYGDAILALRNDPKLYRAKAEACVKLQGPFYDLAHGWGAALQEALQPLRSAAGTGPSLAPNGEEPDWMQRPPSAPAATALAPFPPPPRPRRQPSTALYVRPRLLPNAAGNGTVGGPSPVWSAS